MRHRWPEDTRFTRVVLEVEDSVCAVCGGALHSCDHRRHRIFTLQGPVEVVCKLAHGSDLQGAARAKTRSPYAEIPLTLPWWLVSDHRVRAAGITAHRITSFAWKRMLGGIVRPSACAVFRLITSSNLVGCSTGSSAGFVP